VTRGRLVVHGHFYQPSRLDPFTGRVLQDPTAAPFHDWNARIESETYRPNAERGSLARMSFDLGPTLAGWMAEAAPATLDGFVAGDRGRTPMSAPAAGTDSVSHQSPRNGMAQAFHHAILPLASLADRGTEVRWGLRDFEIRFGRPAEGLWLPETAVDLPTLRVLADAGVRWTILAPWQAGAANVDTRRPYRVELGGGRSIVVAFYDGPLSAAVSFEPSATSDADRFARERVAPRLSSPLPGGEAPLVVIATDGELYGHHQPFRDLFLERLVSPSPDGPDRGFDITSLAEVLSAEPSHRFTTATIRERTSWSCHHGVLRWSAECPDAADGRWKQPLRAAFERLAGAIDAVTAAAVDGLMTVEQLADARDDYVDVVVGRIESATHAARWLGDRAPLEDRRRFEALMEAQRWRLAMFASDGWYWDDPIRIETKQVMRAAARAARLVDLRAGTRLEARLVEDLALFASPGHDVDGATIYRQALAEVGQPPPKA
jgi:hypothetical protein